MYSQDKQAPDYLFFLYTVTGNYNISYYCYVLVLLQHIWFFYNALISVFQHDKKIYEKRII